MNKASVRIHVIIARAASEAIIIRRGPTKQVQLIKWHMKSDTFTHGQWFKGRIYERRCDLSPSGDYFLYFAAKNSPPLGSWTALSRPPYFTALALWAKGDAWGGGGLFKSDNRIQLNHPEYQMKLHDGFKIPKRVQVEQLRESAGRGEDSPIYDLRLMRDGFTPIEGDHPIKHRPSPSSEKVRFHSFIPPVVYTKPYVFSKQSTYQLYFITYGVGEQMGPWWVCDYTVEDGDGKELIALEGGDWADWDSNGDLLFAQKGKIYRLKRNHDRPFLGSVDDAVELVDLNDSKFEEVAPEPWVTRW